jgi:hypothetical protein
MKEQRTVSVNAMSKKTKYDWSYHALAYSFVVFCLGFILHTTAQAQAYNSGRASLLRSDFSRAETQLLAATKSAKSKTELAETYKYLGVAQYMRGNKYQAIASFGRAKSINPAIKLTANEVADESVIPVFLAARPPRANKTSATAAAKPATTGAPGVAKQKSRKTLLKVISNAPSARISLDGIAYGNAGQDIEVQPGTVILEVSSPGFITKAVKVKLEPLTTSSVTVNLERPAPKPKPQVIASQPKTNIPLPGVTAARAGKKDTLGAASKRAKTDLFGDDDKMPEFTEFQQPLDQRPQVAAPQVVTPPPPPQHPVMPPQGYGTTPYGLQPSYPPQAYPQSPVVQQPYPTYPVAPLYPSYPAYPSYPVYQAPTYGPAPYPGQPYGGYSAMPSSPYGYMHPSTPVAPPSPSYTAPTDPYGGYLGPPPEAPISSSPPAIDPEPSISGPSHRSMPPPPILPPPSSTSRSVKRTNTKPEKCSTLVKVLPFGFGQFCKGSTAKGLFFLGSEAGALYFYKANTDAANSYQLRLKEILAEREAARADVPVDEQENFDIETSAKESQGKAVINKAKQNAQYSMLAFVGLWGAGVFDAMTSPDPSASKNIKKKKRSKPRVIHSYNLDLETAPLGTVAMDISLNRSDLGADLYSDLLVGYTPVQDQQNGRLMHALTVGINWDL